MLVLANSVCLLRYRTLIGTYARASLLRACLIALCCAEVDARQHAMNRVRPVILAQQAGSKINEYPGTKLVSTRRYIKITTNKKQNPEKTTKKKIWEKKKNSRSDRSQQNQTRVQHKEDNRKKRKGKTKMNKKRQNKIKRKKTSHLVEIVVDATINCRRLSERRARPCNQGCPQKRQKYKQKSV